MTSDIARVLAALSGSFAVSLLAKMTLVLALGVFVAARARRDRAELRHMILLITIGSALVLPVALMIIPRWDAPLLPPVALPRKADVVLSEAKDRHSPPTFTYTSACPGICGSFIDGYSRSTGLGYSLAVPGVSFVASTLPSVTPIGTGTSRNILWLLWLGGNSLVSLWLVAARLRLLIIGRRACPLDGDAWQSLLHDECVRAGVAQRVRLLVSPVASTPLTWGARRPLILLPEDALQWTNEHKRVVLRHELAHIARNDVLAQLVAGVACAVYWFHPLVWIAANRLRIECERACDSRVISSGVPAADYAAHLLEVARTARALGGPGFLSVAMARPSQLEGRLLAVLDETRPRDLPSRGARWIAFAASLVVVLGVSAFQPVPRMAAPVVSASAMASRSVQSVARTVQGAATSVAAALPLLATDSTFEEAVDVKSGETLTIDLRVTGGTLTITSWDQPRVRVRGRLAGKDWRESEVRVAASRTGAELETRYMGRSRSASFSNRFEIQVPRHFNVRIASAGGGVTLRGVEGVIAGSTGGGTIDIDRATGRLDLSTGGGDVVVENSSLAGSVSTGGGAVRIRNVTGGLTGSAGTGDVLYDDHATASREVQQPSPRPRISVEYRNADIRDVLRAFAAFSKRSIEAGTSMGSRSISAEIKDEPWDVALLAMIASHGLAAGVDADGVIFVDTPDGIANHGLRRFESGQPDTGTGVNRELRQGSTLPPFVPLGGRPLSDNSTTTAVSNAPRDAHFGEAGIRRKSSGVASRFAKRQTEHGSPPAMSNSELELGL